MKSTYHCKGEPTVFINIIFLTILFFFCFTAPALAHDCWPKGKDQAMRTLKQNVMPAA